MVGRPTYVEAAGILASKRKFFSRWKSAVHFDVATVEFKRDQPHRYKSIQKKDVHRDLLKGSKPGDIVYLRGFVFVSSGRNFRSPRLKYTIPKDEEDD